MNKTRYLIHLLCVIGLLSCQSNAQDEQAELTYSPQSALKSPQQPFRAEKVHVEWMLEDWFGSGFKADSLAYSAGTQGSRSSGAVAAVSLAKGSPAVNYVEVYKGDQSYCIPLLRSEKIEYLFEFDPAGTEYKSVQLAGSFNDWNPVLGGMTREGGVWKKTLRLNPGLYSYQLVLDGSWGLDPNNPDSVDNNVGGFNSVLEINKTGTLPEIVPAEIQGNEISIEVKGEIEGFLALWEYARLDSSFCRINGNKIAINIPANAKDWDRSHLWICAWNKNGRSNDLLIPLDKGVVVGSQGNFQPERNDMQSAVMYFALVDRFANGNPNNDHRVDDERIDPRANFYGGDLQGVLEKLEYIRDLGCNSIWLSPINTNPRGAYQEYPEPRRWFSAYHGYWPMSHTGIDSRFGLPEDLDQLVSSAHEADMNILLDFVANHVHQENPLMKQHPDWATDMILADGRVNIRLWEEQRLTTWFDDFLPTLDLSREEIVERVTDSACYWIDRYDIDGFRHDATKHIPELFWRTMTNKVRQRDANFYQIGETFGSRDLIASYIAPSMLDAQFDFPFYFNARGTFIDPNSSFSNLAKELEASLRYFGYHHLMGNITGNHDMARFTSLTGGGIAPGEDPNAVGWEREVEVGSERGYQSMALMIALNVAVPGIPIVYYGDEIGMPGGGDPDSRRMMRFEGWSEEEAELRQTVQYLLKLRRSKPALCYGSTQILEASEDILIIQRSWFDSRIVLILNKGETDQSLDLTRFSTTGSILRGQDQQGQLLIPAMDFAVLEN
jgi:glycosidase